MSKRNHPLDLAKRALPWVATGLLVGYMAWTTDMDTVVEAFSHVSLPLVLLVTLGGTLLSFFLDSLAVQRVFHRLVTPITYRETLPIKATSYFLNLLNYNLALVGMAMYLKRKKDVPFWRSLGALALLNVVDILSVCCMIGVGLVAAWLDGAEALPAARATGQVIVALAIPGFVVFLVLVRLDPKVWWIQKVLNLQLLAPCRTVGLTTILELLLLRFLLLGGYIGVNFLVLRLFSVDVPLSLLLIYQPLLTFVQAVPISVSGLGAPQILMRRFLGPFVPSGVLHPEAVVDASTTTGIFGYVFFRLIVAYLFMGDLSRDVIREARESNR